MFEEHDCLVLGRTVSKFLFLSKNKTALLKFCSLLNVLVFENVSHQLRPLTTTTRKDPVNVSSLLTSNRSFECLSQVPQLVS